MQLCENHSASLSLGCLTYTKWVTKLVLLSHAAFVRSKGKNGGEGALTSLKCFSDVFQFLVLFFGAAYRNAQQGLLQSGGLEDRVALVT